MTQTKKSTFHGAHGSQPFPVWHCVPQHSFNFFFPGVLFHVLLQSFFAAYLCAAVVFLSNSHTHSCTHSSFQITAFLFRPTCVQSLGQPCSVCALNNPYSSRCPTNKELKTAFLTFSLEEEYQRIHCKISPRLYHNNTFGMSQ